ncbi:hypothetical protein CEXT_198751 [Caerostris extrusa]|uniref:Uncharacterized protein n=1 Tax=Caerostris extrusa TaxID=172846 RepID=A0AAV4SKJ8_CAEEX|nr:hypothetical protein CEXT_198751 [Caerostris extrusa]
MLQEKGGRISREYERWTGPLDLPMVTSLCVGGGQEVPDVIRAAAGIPGRPAEGWAPGISRPPRPLGEWWNG